MCILLKEVFAYGNMRRYNESAAFTLNRNAYNALCINII